MQLLIIYFDGLNQIFQKIYNVSKVFFCILSAKDDKPFISLQFVQFLHKVEN